MSETEETLKGRGGPDRGQGRKAKPKDEKLSEPIAIRLTPKAWKRANEIALRQQRSLGSVVQELANFELENWDEGPIII